MYNCIILKLCNWCMKLADLKNEVISTADTGSSLPVSVTQCHENKGMLTSEAVNLLKWCRKKVD